MKLLVLKVSISINLLPEDSNMATIQMPAGVNLSRSQYVPHSITWHDVIGSREESNDRMMEKIMSLNWPYSEKRMTWSREPIAEEDISSGNWKKILTQYVAGLMKAYEAWSGWKLPPLTEETVMKTGTEEDVEFDRIAYITNPNLSSGRSGECLGDSELPPGIPLIHRRMLKKAEKTGFLSWRKTADGKLRLWNTDEVIPEDMTLLSQYRMWCYDEEVLRQIFQR